MYCITEPRGVENQPKSVGGRVRERDRERDQEKDSDGGERS